METCGLLILAGGKSQRMFFPKPYIQYQGKPFFEHIATVYKSTNISKSCLVINRDITTHEWESYYKKALSLFSVVKKIDTHQGRFHSVKTGINALSEMDYCFIHNIIVNNQAKTINWIFCDSICQFCSCSKTQIVVITSVFILLQRVVIF